MMAKFTALLRVFLYVLRNCQTYQTVVTPKVARVPAPSSYSRAGRPHPGFDQKSYGRFRTTPPS